MKKQLGKILPLLLVSTLASLSFTEPTPPADKETPITGRVESATRNVEIFKVGTNGWKKAQSRAALTTDDKIRTGKRSVARVKLADGSKVLLLQNSQAEIEKLSSVQKTIKLLKGRVRAIVAKVKGGNNFQIKTPVGVASVRGTDFEVEMSEDGQQMTVDVNEGQVGVAKLGEMAQEVVLNPGERIRFGIEGLIGDPIRSGAVPMERQDVRVEIQNTQARDSVLSMAAEEERQSDYQVGKSLVDVNGQRVRVEEYIMRPAADQFKLVVLNQRLSRFDYFTYLGTVNTTLPEDLSVALKDIDGKLGTTAPTYYLTGYETKTSNTIDSVDDSATGGHQVKIDFDGTNYTLTDNTDPTNTRTIAAAEDLGNGTFKIYNPLRDIFYAVTAADKDEAIKIGVLDAGTYRNLASGDTYWKTRFNTYSMFVNTTAKTAYAKNSGVANTLAVDLDATFAGTSVISTQSEFPDGTDQLHNKLSLFYTDGSKLVYDNYIIDDQGSVAPASDFEGLPTSAAYKDELVKWNYQQSITATEFGGRKIDLVVDPRIIIQSQFLNQ